jgi:hypothetical protein
MAKEFKCLAVFLKEKNDLALFCVCFLSLGFWTHLVVYTLLFSSVFVCCVYFY